MNNWTKTPPTKAGYYLWRNDELDDPMPLKLVKSRTGSHLVVQDGSIYYRQEGGEWMELIPADEVAILKDTIEVLTVQLQAVHSLCDAADAKLAERDKVWRAEIGKWYNEGHLDGRTGGTFNCIEEDYLSSRAHRIATGQEEPSL